MTRDKLVEQIIRHEGSGPVRNGRMMPYKDSKGILSIAYGRNLEANGVRISEGELMLSNDLDEAIHECFAHIPSFRHLDTVRQSVLTELMFNMGWPTFKQFVNTLDAVDRRDFVAAARGMRQSKWYRDVKADRGDRLVGQMESGIW